MAQIPKQGRRNRVLAHLLSTLEVQAQLHRVLPVVCIDGTISKTARPQGGDLLAICGMDSFAIIEQPPGSGSGERLSRLVAAAMLLRPVMLDTLSLRVGGTPETRLYESNTHSQVASSDRDPELPVALQDLADEITVDIVQVCATLDDPGAYMPGVDGIEPVTDAHVTLVISAMQRELDRELRLLRGAVRPSVAYVERPVMVFPWGGEREESVRRYRAAVQLAELPWSAQRALVERRRLRFQQWGITRDVWKRGTWSVWDIPEDPDWTPRFVTYQESSIS